MAHQPLVGQGLPIIEASRSHSDTPHSVGLLRTSYQVDTENSTWQTTPLTRDRCTCTQQDSNPQSQQASGRRPTALGRAATWTGTIQNYSQLFQIRYSHSFTAFYTRLQLLSIKICFRH